MYQELTIVPSGPQTVSGQSAVFDTLAGAGIGGPAQFDEARFFLNVTAASGTTPNLAVKIVGTFNGVDYDLTPTFAAKTAAGKETIMIDKCPRFVRVVWTITGTTPSFTFEAGVVR